VLRGTRKVDLSAEALASALRFAVVAAGCSAAAALVAFGPATYRQLLITCLALAGVVVAGVCFVAIALAPNELLARLQSQALGVQALKVLA
jgi:hypothetical protein